MPTIDNWRALREALDAGPTEGPWELSQDDGWPWTYKVNSPSAGYYVLSYGLWNYSTSDTKEKANARPNNAECAANARWFAAAHPAAIRSLLDERDRLAAEVEALKDAARINLENYEFQRNKADAATATVYQFHYAMKDAGWHPGRTDDNLCDILRAKGQELAGAAAEVEALRADDAKRDAIMLEVDYALDHGWPATSLNRIDRMRAAMKGKP